jgi:hypothetical protein
MDLSGNDLDSATRTILAEAGENATPASRAAVASVARNRLAAGGYGKSPQHCAMPRGLAWAGAVSAYRPIHPAGGNPPQVLTEIADGRFRSSGK